MRTIERQHQASFPVGSTPLVATYRLEDIVRLKGPFVAGGASYRMPMSSDWSFLARTTVGVIFAKSTDTVTGTATTGADEARVGIAGAAEEVSSTPVFVMPELGAQFRAGSWRLGASVVALFVPQSGPDFPRDTISVAPDCDTASPGVGCAPEARILGGERAYGALSLWMPMVSATTVF